MLETALAGLGFGAADQRQAWGFERKQAHILDGRACAQADGPATIVTA